MNDTTNAAALTVGQPVVILTGLPYSMTWEEIDDLEDKEGVLAHVDTAEFERAEPVPYRVQLVDGGEPVCVQKIRPIVEPVHALAVATKAAEHLAARVNAVAGEYYEYSLSTGGRLASIQDFADAGEMPDAVRAELKKLLAED